MIGRRLERGPPARALALCSPGAAVVDRAIDETAKPESVGFGVITSVHAGGGLRSRRRAESRVERAMNPGPEKAISYEARLSPDVLFRELAGEAVLLDLKSQRYFGLDEVGTRIWQLLEERGEIEAVLRAMVAEFDVAEEELRQDLDAFLHQLTDAGLIELTSG